MSPATTTRSVLITDLRDSTQLRVRVGDAAFDALRREHDELLGAAARDRGGEVLKGSGDGVIVLFEAAHEAIGAAVSMQQAVAARNRRAADELALAIGVSAGDVALEDGDCHGLPVVEAARLCNEAAAGEVLVADVVRLLAGTRTDQELTARGPLELKGLPAPLVTWEVRWAPDTAAAGSAELPDALRAGQFAFVGREAERARLRTAWKEAVAGSTRLVLVSGEPGIGKTRLVADLAAEVHAGGDTVLYGRCNEDLPVPYQPFIEPMLTLLRSSPDLSEAHVAEHGSLVARLHPSLTAHLGEPPPIVGDPETERERTFDAACDLLGAACGEAPVLLVLDDLHWASAPTLGLLRHVLRRTPDARLAIVGTYRDTDLDRTHPLAATLADLRRDGVGERIALSGLDADDVMAFLTAAAGHELDAPARQLAVAVHRETEGNPFFVAEVLVDLAESGAIQQSDGRWETTGTVASLRLPQGVREVIGRRLSHQSEATNKVLTVAAVVGPSFEIATLEAVHEPADEVLDALEAAEAASLVAEDTARVGWFAFTHSLVRQTLLGELTMTRRLRLHKAIGIALEARHGRDPAAVADLAYHFCAAAPLGETARAVEYATGAFEQARDRFAPEEALAWLERALEADEIDPVRDPHRRAALLAPLARAHFAFRGDREAALAADLERAALLREIGDDDAFAEAVGLAVGDLLPWGQTDPQVESLVEEALAKAPARSQARAILLTSEALQAILNAGGRDPVALAAEALELANATGADTGVRTRAAMAHAHALQCTSGARQHLAEARALFAADGQKRSPDDPLFENQVPRYILGYALARAGDLDELSANSAALIDTATRTGNRIRAAAAAQWAFLDAALTGPLDGAEALANAVLEHSGREPMFMAGHALQITWLRVLQGRLDEAGTLADVLFDLMPPEMSLRGGAKLLVAIERGDGDAVRAILPTEPLAMLQPDWSRSATLHSLAGASYVTGDAELGRAAYDLLLPYDGQLLVFVCTHVCASAAHALALAAAGMGDHGAAIRHAHDAVAYEEGLGARVLAARSRVLLAELLADHDPNESRRTAAEAQALATDLGMTVTAARAAALA